MLCKILLSFFIACFSFLSAQETYDIVIVGGGASGTYSGFRLTEHFKEKKVSKSILLMEASNRIGGRLFSYSYPEMPGLVAEIGGMRFLDVQENVTGLVDYLKLKKEYFDKDSTENITYLRRVRMNKGDFFQKLPYNLREEEKGKSSRELMLLGVLKAVPEVKTIPPKELKEFLKTKEFEGTPLWQIGFWNLLMNELSIEAYHLIRDAGGYFSFVSNWNAYNAILAFSKYLKDVTFYKLPEGLDQLPKKLAERYEQNGGKLSLNTQVISLKQVKVNQEKLIQVFYKTGNKLESCYARHVILAMPKRAIELLDQDSFPFKDEQFVMDLKRVAPENASKVFLWYDDPWWTKLGFSNGPSRTDLPLRQCYYFGTSQNKGLLMASYSDGIAVDFWEGYYPESAFDRVSDRFVNLPDYIQKHIVPPKMIEELTQELSEIHGVDAAKPRFALFQNWGEDPYGGGWHYWNPHNQSWIVMPRIRHPIKEENLYICGEAYSDQQGWIEGALNTAEKMLEDYFGLPRPSWISATYDLGP